MTFQRSCFKGRVHIGTIPGERLRLWSDACGLSMKLRFLSVGESKYSISCLVLLIMKAVMVPGVKGLNT